MKIKVFVAFIAAATIIFLSCNWFRSKKKEVSNPLIGEWKLDSVKMGNNARFESIPLTRAMLDTTIINLSITKDAIVTHSQQETDTVGYSFDEKAKQLITKDSINPILSFAKLNDSLITLTTKDSTVLFLQKK